MPVETKDMMKKKILLAMAAAGWLALGNVAPAGAQEDPPPPPEDGTMIDVPPDPDSLTDPGTDELPGEPAEETGDPAGEGGDSGATGADQPD